MTNNILFIVRGASGSGKTTLAEQLSKQYNCPYYEADQYFMRKGEYRFDRRLLPAAHNWCRSKVFQQLLEGKCVVSNTFTKVWEVEPYVTHILNMRGTAVIIDCTGRYQNVHGLSDEQVEKQRKRFDSMDSIKSMLEAVYGSELRSTAYTAHDNGMIFWLDR